MNSCSKEAEAFFIGRLLGIGGGWLVVSYYPVVSGEANWLGVLVEVAGGGGEVYVIATGFGGGDDDFFAVTQRLLPWIVPHRFPHLSFLFT